MPHSRPVDKRILLLALALGACARRQPAAPSAELPTGRRLDPAGVTVGIGQMPLTMRLAPDGRQLVVLLSGYRDQGIQVIDRASGAVTQDLPQRAAFLGLAFGPDDSTLYASGGGADVIFRYRWIGSRAELRDSVVLGSGKGEGREYAAGLAVSPSGTRVYVALNVADSLAVVDPETQRVIQRLPTGRYPYDVLTTADGTVYVSAWGAEGVNVYHPAGDSLVPAGVIPAGRHPSAMTASPDGTRLYVASASTDRIAVIDTRAGRVIATLQDPPPGGPDEGSTPNGLALTPDARYLLVAEADNNAVALFGLSAATSGQAGAAGSDSLSGRVPVGWYPTAVVVAGDTLLVANGKGSGTGPNPDGRRPGERLKNERAYTLGQLLGSLTTVPFDPADRTTLSGYSTRVATANRWLEPRNAAAGYPPFEHVIYIIKENRTYDQVLGDLPAGDGDSTLVFFPRAVSPNHHALAERFGVFDRFFVNAEVSADGHMWTTAAYAPDYVEKTVQPNYRGDGRGYEYEGENRGRIAEDDVNEPANGYLWDLAERAGITLRNYGEFVIDDTSGGTLHYTATKPFLRQHTDSLAPGWDLDIPDQRRADEWLREFQGYVQSGELPRLEILRLPNDHTSGARAGAPTPRAQMADNDLALGRVIEALSRSPFWKNTVVFVLEDDAQDGPDHVDSHRSPLLVISAYSHSAVVSRFANTTDVIATIAEILGLGSLSQFDYYGQPLRGIWVTSPDLAPYAAITPGIPLDERNPSGTAMARDSRRLELAEEDRSDDNLFNRILWRTIKGPDAPYPGVRRISLLDLHRGR